MYTANSTKIPKAHFVKFWPMTNEKLDQRQFPVSQYPPLSSTQQFSHDCLPSFDLVSDVLTIYLSALVIEHFTCSVFLGSTSPSHREALCTVLWLPSAPLLPQAMIHSNAIANNVGWEAYARTHITGGRKKQQQPLACYWSPVRGNEPNRTLRYHLTASFWDLCDGFSQIYMWNASTIRNAIFQWRLQNISEWSQHWSMVVIKQLKQNPCLLVTTLK